MATLHGEPEGDKGQFPVNLIYRVSDGLRRHPFLVQLNYWPPRYGLPSRVGASEFNDVKIECQQMLRWE
jgi:hypothetical protein